VLLRRQTVRETIGRKLLDRLIAERWLVPIQRGPREYWLEDRDVRAALRRLATEGDRILVRRVRNASATAYARKPKPSIEETLADIEL
jgi:hypothetical protein